VSPTFDQFVGFVALTFRTAYLTLAREAFPELEPQLPLARGAALTVLRVNAGEAIHFLLVAAPRRGDATCREAIIEAPEGWSVADWARLEQAQYLRFVERAAGLRQPDAHFVLFPDDEAHGAAVQAAERAVMAHAAAARTEA